MLEIYLSLYPTKAEALRELNKALGASYGYNKIYEWANGTRPIPKPVENYIRAKIAPTVFKSCGVNTDPRTAVRIAKKLS